MDLKRHFAPERAPSEAARDMSFIRIVALTAMLASLSAGARAADAKLTSKSPPAKTRAAESSPDDVFGHHGQLDARADVVAGYQMLFRYSSSPRCAPYDYAKPSADQQKFCGLAAAPALGVAIGYSPVDFFEPFLFARFGLADEATRT